MAPEHFHPCGMLNWCLSACLAYARHASLQAELRQAGSAVETVRKQTAGVVEAKEDADGHLASASTAHDKARKKVEEAEARAREEEERRQRHERARQ